jgi:putative pyruvate formate lyase activating enzyme
VGRKASASDIADMMLELEKKGAHNINFVTPTHFAPTVRDAVDIARGKGLILPIVYNTGSYDSIDALDAVRGRVDIFLADLKYHKSSTAGALSFAEDYPSTAKSAIAEMVRQQPTPTVESGIMKKGVIVRILLLPSHLAEAKLSLKYLYSTYGNNIYISLMSQYTPIPGMKAPLDRRVTHSEYRELVDYAEKIGVTNAFTQEVSSSEEAYIPDFYLERD